MKFTALVLIVLVSACGSWTKQFKRQNVCSDSSLAYLKANKARYVKNDDARVKKKISKIADEVKACYKAEVRRDSYSKPSFNLCLVGGYDSAGKMEHFEFSTKEYRMSEAMVKCLSNIKTNKGLKGTKNLVFVQPYRLKPKKSY